ncbi:hypothetical protein FGE12_12980 [Aggregicoccus sp. 17bor-14]|uniref:hypothetical protein n=1 Tax=Myxococcaceae TaxID=31 RepID=UPI00129CE277|nr:MULTISPECIES: hypothetical protein [Myxococcaceae]MBF5043305.1 hypothetical protein [Simulacricoccus sp. 17bor-14]MRI89064.1 hypothetical protein [Aggregicoccus sp. 17bor-14]
MSPLVPLAPRALLFIAAIAAGALLLRSHEAHCCDPAPCLESQGERLTLRPLSSRVDGVEQPLPATDGGTLAFSVANDWMEPNEAFASASLYDPEHPATPRARLMRRAP